MKNIILFILLSIPAISHSEGFRTCASWDTFCKNPAQIVATKCRLGVPVKHEECNMLGIQSHYLVRGGGSLVPGLPYSETEGLSTEEILNSYISNN